MLILGQVIHAKKPEGDPLVNGLIMKAVQQCLVLHSPMGDIQHKGIEHMANSLTFIHGKKEFYSLFCITSFTITIMLL